MNYLSELETALELLDFGKDDLDAQERVVLENCLTNVERALKVLKIIIEKRVDIILIKNECLKLDAYNKCCPLFPLTEEEFNLLWGVLHYEK